jgi:cytosine/creatinine deaminase
MSDSQPHEPGLLLCGARLVDGRTVDVRLGGGRIEAVGTAGSLAGSGPKTPGRGKGSGGEGHRDGGAAGNQPPEGSRVDMSGYLLLPAPAEPHAHHDTAFTAAFPVTGPGAGGAPPGSVEDVQRRTTEAALLQLSLGATAARTHVRVGDVTGLRALEAVLQARRSLRGLTDLDAVAMPRLLTGVAGADGLAMLRDAVKMGAAVVGGCPDLDPDPAGYVDAVLEVAAEQGCAVDLHTDGDDPARLSRLAAAAGGLRPGVSVGPCAGLARVPQEAAARAAERLAAAGVTVVSLPQGNCAALEGTSPPGAAASGMPPVRLLHAAGVSVTAGSGALRDAANPVGRGDPLEAAYLLATHGGCDADAAYATVAARARAALGLPEVRVEAGFPAELLAVRGAELAGALSLAYSRIVVHRGRVVTRTSAVREYCGFAASQAEFELPRQQSQD